MILGPKLGVAREPVGARLSHGPARPLLDRSTHPVPAPPVRSLHLGVWNFSRAHQPW